MTQTPQNLSYPAPISAGSPLPHRKEIRAWIKPLSQPHIFYAVIWLTIDCLGFGACIAGSVLFLPLWAKLICAISAGIMIGRLFVIGHDACHQSYTPIRALNRVLGRIAMLPSLTPYSLWQTGHNTVHHGYTNLKGVDFVWAPLTQVEYQALSPARRMMERVYRSGWGSLPYYLIEMWWLRMFFPSKRYMPVQRKEFSTDSAIAAATAILWVAGLVFAALATNQSVWLIVFFGFVVPFLIWNLLIGLVVYLHHTHPAVQWYDDKDSWAAASPFVSTTVHLTFPLGFGGLLHHIMEHTAHHVDMSLPLYCLKRAQHVLEKTLPDKIVIQQFSLRWYLDTVRRCKLYDFERGCWTDFQGSPT